MWDLTTSPRDAARLAPAALRRAVQRGVRLRRPRRRVLPGRQLVRHRRDRRPPGRLAVRLGRPVRDRHRRPRRRRRPGSRRPAPTRCSRWRSPGGGLPGRPRALAQQPQRRRRPRPRRGAPARPGRPRPRHRGPAGLEPGPQPARRRHVRAVRRRRRAVGRQRHQLLRPRAHREGRARSPSSRSRAAGPAPSKLAPALPGDRRGRPDRHGGRPPPGASTAAPPARRPAVVPARRPGDAARRHRHRQHAVLRQERRPALRAAACQTGGGPQALVDPYDDPFWSPLKNGSGPPIAPAGQTYRGVLPSFYSDPARTDNPAGDLPSVTSMFYDPDTSRLFYTLAGKAGCSPAPSARTSPAPPGAVTTGGVIFPNATTVPGVSPVRLGDRRLPDRRRASTTRPRTARCTGSPSRAASPVGDAGHRRRRHGLELAGALPAARGGGAARRRPRRPRRSPAPATAPAARFDSSGSADPDGTITARSWDFGDGSSGDGGRAAARLRRRRAPTRCGSPSPTPQGLTGTVTHAGQHRGSAASAVAFRAAGTAVSATERRPPSAGAGGRPAGDALVLTLTTASGATAAAPAGLDRGGQPGQRHASSPRTSSPGSRPAATPAAPSPYRCRRAPSTSARCSPTPGPSCRRRARRAAPRPR